MTAVQSISRAKARFAALVARAEAGEEIIIARRGRPVARLVPLIPPAPLRYGDLAGLHIADDLSLPRKILEDFEPG